MLVVRLLLLTLIQKLEKLRIKDQMLVTINILDTKIGEVKNRIPYTSEFINAPEFHKLPKINFNARVKEV